MATLPVPVTVDPKAAARVAELGHRDAFERMLEKVTEYVPGLVEIQVDLVPDYEEGGDPGIMFMGLVDARVGIDNPGCDRWAEWKLATYPPDIFRHYSLWTAPVEVGHAG
jgi:hypothetical protein